MKRLIVLIILLCISLFCYSQKRGNIWCFGDSCLMDYNTSPPSTGSCINRSRGTAVSIADESGDLLFYGGSPRISVWQSGYFGAAVIYNSNHQVMENGDSLHGELWYREMIIIPDPGNAQKYYVFHVQLSGSNMYNGFFYSVVDLSYNNGLGKVTSKNNQLLVGNMADGLGAIKHGNGKDWWLLARQSGFQSGDPPNNDFYVYLIDSTGIHQQPVQSVGTLNPTNLCKISFNGIGDKFVFNNAQGMVELYDFDRCTGLITNPITIEPNAVVNPRLLWSNEFSPNGRYLYTSTSDTISFIYQYDLFAANIQSSRQTINAFNDFTNAGGELKRGPDNKIYYAIAWNYNGYFNFPYPDTAYNMYNMNLGVINQPDSPAAACDFQPFSFYLGGKRNYWGLPNNPDYDLGPLVGSGCDTILLNLYNYQENAAFSIFPNPVINGELSISNVYSSRPLVLSINTNDGREVARYKLPQSVNEYKLKLPVLSPGLYIARLYDVGFHSYLKFIVE